MHDVRRSRRRSAALIATAVSVPVTVILALALAARSRPAGTAHAPTPGSRDVAACQRLAPQLPRTLGGADLNSAASRPPLAISWGKPPLVLECGVPRPPQLAPYSTAQLIGSGDNLSVNWLPIPHGSATDWIVIDRSVYLRLTVPNDYATPPINALSNVIARTLPPVCSVSMTAGVSRSGSSGSSGVLCTHRP